MAKRINQCPVEVLSEHCFNYKKGTMTVISIPSVSTFKSFDDEKEEQGRHHFCLKVAHLELWMTNAASSAS